MSAQNFIKLKTPTNFHKINMFSKNKEKFNKSKKLKLKPNFRQYQNILNKKKFSFNRANLYRSFINSSAPFNYYKSKTDKNTYLICYNGGPKVFSFINKNDSKKELDCNIDYNKEVIYNNIKSCGCPSKQNVPKFPRNLSYIENKEYNKIDKNKKLFNTYEKKINYFISRPLSNNTRNYNGFRSAKSLRRSNDGKIIYTLKKFLNKNNNSMNNLYENETGDNNIKKKKLLENNRYISCYAFRPRVNKIFHRNQIFDHCKPFLTDDFQEYPD